jgi:hypothetical protein
LLVREGQQLLHDRRRLRDGELYDVRRRRCDVGDDVVEQAAVAGGLAPPVERRHHVGAVEGAAVVERDAFAQGDREDVRRRVELPRLGQHRLRLERRVDRPQAFVDVPRDLLVQERRGAVRVERRRGPGRRDDQCVVARGPGIR